MTSTLMRGRAGSRRRLRGAALILTAALCLLGCSQKTAPAPAQSPAAAASAAPSAATSMAPAGTTTRQLEVSGQVRHYRLHVPPGYRTGNALPLVLNLHGLGETAEQQERLSGMSAIADTEGFFVVYPEGLGSPTRWDIGPGAGGQQDLAFMRALVDTLAGELLIDAHRVYATGISNGGGMVNRMGCELADRFAAIAPVSGDYQRYQDCSPGRPVPVIAFHGTADKLVPYQGNRELLLPPIPTWAAAWAARNGCAAAPTQTSGSGRFHQDTWNGCREGAIVTLYTIEGGEHIWPGAALLRQSQPAHDVDATRLMWAFFVAHPHP